MQIDQPTPTDLILIDRVSCCSCHFSREFRNPVNALEKYFVCKYFPATPAFMPTQNGPAMFGSQQPQVIKPQWCYQWRPRILGYAYDDEKAPMVREFVPDLTPANVAPKILPI